MFPHSAFFVRDYTFLTFEIRKAFAVIYYGIFEICGKGFKGGLGLRKGSIFAVVFLQHCVDMRKGSWSQVCRERGSSFAVVCLWHLQYLQRM